jgi:hypothetical protein
MENSTSFGEVLEAVGRLSPDEQETLLDIVRHRLADHTRKRLVQDVLEAREEFAQGTCSPASVDDLMHEIVKSRLCRPNKNSYFHPF